MTPGLASAGPAESEGVRVRISLSTEVVHGQGYWSPSLRVGQDGGFGLRVGAMRAPMWAEDVPPEVIKRKPQFDLENINYVEVDYEVCGQRWCGGLGFAQMSDLSYMNGTKWNFGVHVRFAIDKNWSLVYDHYSHGAALGFAEDKSNRGWNLLGVAYTF